MNYILLCTLLLLSCSFVFCFDPDERVLPDDRLRPIDDSEFIKPIRPDFPIIDSEELIIDSEAAEESEKIKDLITIQEIENFNTAMLNAHNYYRKLHGAPLLTLNMDLYQKAKDLAKDISSGSYPKSDHYNSAVVKKLDADEITRSWYNSIASFNFTLCIEEDLVSVSNFTRIVWASTTDFVASFTIKDNIYYVATIYDPANYYNNDCSKNIFPLPKSVADINKSKGKSAGKTAGIVIGVLVGVAVIVAVIIFVIHSRRKTTIVIPNNTTTANATTTVIATSPQSNSSNTSGYTPGYMAGCNSGFSSNSGYNNGFNNNSGYNNGFNNNNSGYNNGFNNNNSGYNNGFNNNNSGYNNGFNNNNSGYNNGFNNNSGYNNGFNNNNSGYNNGFNNNNSGYNNGFRH